MEAVRQAADRLQQSAAKGRSSYPPMEAGALSPRGPDPAVWRQSSGVACRTHATIQTLGPGALARALISLKRYFPDSAVWVSDPTRENHVAIFAGAGFEVHTYPRVRQRHPRVNFCHVAASSSAAAAQHCAASPLLP
ncbi:aminotransferase class I/II-fold pyridoxal phosphate-dependent enzyme [Klebsiella pneumoniae]|uniref:Aminotransferase class I/II-fold pyridoxal phosphate-dependent enzyme n=1 Tax=Klebsiella pneumoniae TaxID=573 RepID=A0A939NTV9_KLEPN|nr:aminotransferase class I/II-fold pyridoxal phosphate-dependent enzyme [Klebsiella pneumoniae]